MTTWVVVADAARARIFESRRRGQELIERDTLLHPESRLKTADLMSDNEGTVMDRVGEGQRRSDPRTNPQDAEMEKFAREVASFLDKKRSLNEFDELIIAASPNFLGNLRQRISDQVTKCVVDTLDKDYSRLPKEEIAQRLQQQLH
jgi:protein required for attachment to host cells